MKTPADWAMDAMHVGTIAMIVSDLQCVIAHPAKTDEEKTSKEKRISELLAKLLKYANKASPGACGVIERALREHAEKMEKPE